MTERQWFDAAARRLAAAGCEDGAFDARCLLEDMGGMGRGRMPGDRPLTPEQEARLVPALERRAGGYPLQYLLGTWDFLSLTLRVGEGVLIPRPDTEVLCEESARLLQGADRPRVLDLCAGSGCVGLGVASLVPTAQVTAVELSDAALPYLRENVAAYPALSVTVRQADVLTDAGLFDGGCAAILSNPPYIPTGDLAGLQREVQHEPALALDGHADGLHFYRAIARDWCGKLMPGGFCAVEVGIGQAKAVAALFAAAGLERVYTVADTARIPRVVVGFAREKSPEK